VTRWVVLKTPWWECLAAGVPFLMDRGDSFSVVEPAEYLPPLPFEHDVIMNPHRAPDLPNGLGDELIGKWRAYPERVRLFETENLLAAHDWRARSARLREQLPRTRWLNYSSANASIFGDEYKPFRRLLSEPKKRLRISGGPDVVFVGSMNERRALILDELRARGLDVVVPPFGTFGADLSYHEQAAKLVLNIHYYSPGVFEAFRVVPAWHRGCRVLSEVSVNGEGQEWCETVPYYRLAARAEEICHGS
jgi:hypothetical protein